MFCAACLLWPALWNGYPIVFADTGTYLSQAMHRYLGWDRPVFYSLFIYPLHLGLTTWPVISVQSCLTIWVLDLARRAFGLTRAWLPALTLFLSAASSLPWIVSELMPDLFTPLLVVLLSVLVFSSHRFARWEQTVLIVLAALMIASQQSSVLLSLALLSAFILARRRPMTARFAPLLAPGLAVAALVTVNTAGFGRVALSPYGNVFVLARVIYDGPGMAVLRRDCPERGWLLCPWLDRFPATSDEFLWDPSSPAMLAGGHKAVSADADEIIRAALLAQPGRSARAALNNTLEQLVRFESGDGLEAWPEQVQPRIDHDFPSWEANAYHGARQQRGTLAVPFAAAHRVVALAGIAAAIVFLPAAWRRRHVAAWFLASSLLSLPVSAAITGGLSTPHDRYQSRIVWLPAMMVFLTVPALRSRRGTE